MSISIIGDDNRIYNKVLDRDWFSTRLFVTQSASDHMGVTWELFVIGYPCDWYVN